MTAAPSGARSRLPVPASTPDRAGVRRLRLHGALMPRSSDPDATPSESVSLSFRPGRAGLHGDESRRGSHPAGDLSAHRVRSGDQTTVQFDVSTLMMATLPGPANLLAGDLDPANDRAIAAGWSVEQSNPVQRAGTPDDLDRSHASRSAASCPGWASLMTRPQRPRTSSVRMYVEARCTQPAGEQQHDPPVARTAPLLQPAAALSVAKPRLCLRARASCTPCRQASRQTPVQSAESLLVTASRHLDESDAGHAADSRHGDHRGLDDVDEEHRVGDPPPVEHLRPEELGVGCGRHVAY